MKRNITLFMLTFALLMAALLVFAACGEKTADLPAEQTTAAPEASFTVSFNSNGGSEVSAQSVQSGAKAIKPADPTRAGYLFNRWTFQGETWSFDDNTVTSDLTLDANWRPVYTFSGNSITGLTDTGKQLTEISIPSIIDNVEIRCIRRSAFWGRTGLISVTIPDSVTRIEQYAFQNCTDLKNVTIGKNVTDIDNNAFDGCTGLTSIIIPDSVARIGDRAFYGCPIETATLPTSACPYFKKDNLKTVVICGTSIMYEAFSNCKNLTSVTIPDSVTSIEDFAFYGCTGLTSVTIPDSVTNIGQYAFYNCSGLTSVTIPNRVTSIRYSAFYGCTGLTSVTIPDSVTSIGNSAFICCRGLTSVTIPDSVTCIGDYAFYGCTGLTSITIPESVTSIGVEAFHGCTGLTSITIPDSVTSIVRDAFYGCTGLTSVTIPNSVTSIEDRAFYNCKGLTSITYQGAKAQWNAISKGSSLGFSWNSNTGAYTIHCTDGDLAKS